MIWPISFSMMGVLPALMRSTFLCSGSTPMMSWPSWARQPAETAPTYPRPSTLILITAPHVIGSTTYFAAQNRYAGQAGLPCDGRGRQLVVETLGYPAKNRGRTAEKHVRGC